MSLRSGFAILSLLAAAELSAYGQFEIWPVTHDKPVPEYNQAYTLEGRTTKKTVLLEDPVLLDAYAIRSASVKSVGAKRRLILELTDEGVQRLKEMEKKYAGRQVGIVIDGHLLLAPTLKGPNSIAVPINIPIALPEKETADALEKLNSYNYSEFASDLLVPNWPVGASVDPKLLSEAAVSKLNAVHSGISRETVDKLCWRNGGLTVNASEYLINDLRVNDSSLGARIYFRPQAMPVDIYTNPDQRKAWLLEHRPPPSPQDVVFAVTKPFHAAVVID